MLPPSMSTRTLLAGTNKMSITCGYLHRADLRPRRRLQLLQHQRLRLLQQPRPQRQRLLLLRYGYGYSHGYCHSHSYGHINSNSYCYSQTDADAEISADAEAATHAIDPGRSYGALSTVLAPTRRMSRPAFVQLRRGRHREAATINLPTRALCEFQSNLVTS